MKITAAALYTAWRHGEKESEHVYEVGGLQINDDLKEVTVDGEKVKLTPIEYNILLLLMKNQGRVFSIDQIYESIWNEEAIGADNTGCSTYSAYPGEDRDQPERPEIFESCVGELDIRLKNVRVLRKGV